MRRWATSERTMTRRTHQPARRIRLASSACISRARAVSATPTSSDEAGTTIVPRASSKCKLDYEPQLEGRMTLQAAAHSACNSARHLSRNLRFLAVFHRVLEKTDAHFIAVSWNWRLFVSCDLVGLGTCALKALVPPRTALAV